MSKLLMIGTGPVAIQLANICYLKSDYEIDMVGRASTSEKSKRLYQAYKKEKQFEVKIQNEAHQHLEGNFAKCQTCHFNFTDIWIANDCGTIYV